MAVDFQCHLKPLAFPISAHEAEHARAASGVLGDGLEVSVGGSDDSGDFLRKVGVFPHHDVLDSLSAGDERLEVRAMKLLPFDREVFAGAEVEMLPGLQSKAAGCAGAVLGGHVLLHGVFVRVDDVEPKTIGGISKKLRNGVAKDITIMPPAPGGFWVKFDEFHPTGGNR